MGLPDFSTQRPVTTMMIFLAVIIVGFASLAELPVELMPNVSMSDISIIVRVRGGMPPESIENLVTRPVEDSVSTVSHLRNIVSTSKKGESRVVLQFEAGTNMEFAALEVREKFSTVKEKLPPEIEKPVIAQYKESDRPIVLIAITGKRYSPTYIRRLVDEKVKEKIMRVEGVANIDVYGGRARKILVEVDQDRLQAFGLSIHSVISVLGRNNLNLLAGDINRKSDKYLIRTMGIFNSIADVENITVATTTEGSAILVKDVAIVADSYLDPESYARVDVNPVVSLYIFKESTANTVQVADGVIEALDVVQKEDLPSDMNVQIIHNQAKSIVEAIGTVKQSLVWGGVLAIVVLIIFLREIRSTIVIGLTIPISVMATFCLMFFARAGGQDITLNIMTLSGLALGIGMLVDNSIVVLENIAKKRSQGVTDQTQAAVSGTSEVMLAIAASTVTTIVVFLPFVFVNKEIQLTWSGLALTVTFSLVASLFVATTLVPMLSARLGEGRKLFTRKSSLSHHARPPRRIYYKLLGYFLRYRYIFCANIILLFVIALLTCQHVIERQLDVQGGEGRFSIYVDLEPGANLDISNIMVKQVEALVEDIPEIASTSTQVEPASSQVHVRLLPRAKRLRGTKEIIDDIRAKVAEIEKHYKGGFIYFSEIQGSEFEEITLDLFGHNYETLKTLAGEVSTRISSIPGLTDIRMSRIEGRPEWGVDIDKEKAALFGLDVQQISEVLHAKMQGLRATYYHTESKEIEMVVRMQKKYRMRLDDLRKLTVMNSQNQQIYLKDIATFVPKMVPGNVFRKNKNRLMSVTATSTQLSLDTVVEQVHQTLDDMEFPKDYYYRIGGTYYQDVKNFKELTSVFGLTILLVYMVLASLFESYSQPLLIMFAVPMAAIGVAAGLLITHQAISKGVLVGAIMLAGIVVNNSIVLVDHINHLRKRGKETLDAVLNGAEDRVRPIFMTTSTTVLGLLPMAADKSESAALWAPLAITVIGGLLSSTLLTLFLIPSFYMISEDIKLFPRRTMHIINRLFGRRRRKPSHIRIISKKHSK